MIVADTSSLISLTTADLLETFLTEYDVHITETVVEELENTAEYNDAHGNAANQVLNYLDQVTVHETNGEVTSSRVDSGEGTCVLLTRELDAEFLLTDDLHALPELQNLVDSQVAISPIVLKALVKRNVLEREDTLEKLDQLAEQRDWLGRPIYRRAKNLFE